MKHSVYIFGDLGSGYAQYPDDFAKRILAQGSEGTMADTQIAIHREGDSVYYTYYRKLLGGTSPKGYVGFSICFNGVYCTDAGRLFDIFEQGVAELAVSGRLIAYSPDGSLQAKADKFDLRNDEAALVRTALARAIGGLSPAVFKDLPPVSQHAETGQEKHCPVIDVEKELPKLIKTANKIVVHKDANYKLSPAAGSSRQHADFNAVNRELRNQNKTLIEKVTSLTKQKNQYKLVAILASTVFLAMIGFIIFGHSIITLRGEVEDKESIIADNIEKIKLLENDVLQREMTIGSLQREIESQKEQISQNEAFLARFASNVPCPIAISNIELRNGTEQYGEKIYSSNSTYIYSQINVHSLIDKTVDIFVKFYGPNGMSATDKSPSGYTFKSTLNVKKNQTVTFSLQGWGSGKKGYWKSGSYRIEYWYKDFCLGKKSFRIYDDQEVRPAL